MTTTRTWIDESALPPNLLAEKRAAARRLRQERWQMDDRHRHRAVRGQLILFVVMLALWPLRIFNPVKLLVVLFHETSHLIAAYATGGIVFGLAIDPGGAGVTLGMSGYEPMIVAAGYAGSLAIGALLYYFSAEWPPGQVWLVLVLLCCASLSMGWLNDFTVVFGYGTIALLLCGLGLPADLKRMFIRLVATTSCLYSVIDVLSEALRGRADGFVVRGEVVGSDVGQMARLSGMPVWLIAGLWGLTGLAIAIMLVRWSAQRDLERAIEEEEEKSAATVPPQFQT